MTTNMGIKEYEVVRDLTDRIRALLVGKPAHISGVVLADLVAIWLAGHLVRDSQAETDTIRETLLEMHLGKVRALVPINAAILGTDQDKR